MLTMTMAKKSLIRLAWKEAGLSEENLGSCSKERYGHVIAADSLNCYELFDELEKTRQGKMTKEGRCSRGYNQSSETLGWSWPYVGEFNAVGIVKIGGGCCHSENCRLCEQEINEGGSV